MKAEHEPDMAAFWGAVVAMVWMFLIAVPTTVGLFTVGLLEFYTGMAVMSLAPVGYIAFLIGLARGRDESRT